MKRKAKTNKQNKQNKKGSVSNDLAIILWFAGACLIALFLFGFLVLKHWL